MGRIIRERIDEERKVNWLCVKSEGMLWFGYIWIEKDKVKANWGLKKKTFENVKDLVGYVEGV